MTITTELDLALDEERIKRANGKRPKDMMFRMGPSALAALAADGTGDAGEDGLPTRFRDVPIERVDPPSNPFAPATRDRFHGWELRA